jgi:Phage integrase family
MAGVLKKAGLPLHFTPHCLRRTYASLMLQQGESPAYVQRQLGHASIQLTVDTYGKWLPMGNKAKVDRLDALPMVASGSKMVATEGGESRKVWSWREELNLQPAVYKTAALPLSYASRMSDGIERMIDRDDSYLQRKPNNCVKTCQAKSSRYGLLRRRRCG